MCYSRFLDRFLDRLVGCRFSLCWSSTNINSTKEATIINNMSAAEILYVGFVVDKDGDVDGDEFECIRFRRKCSAAEVSND